MKAISIFLSALLPLLAKCTPANTGNRIVIAQPITLSGQPTSYLTPGYGQSTSAYTLMSAPKYTIAPVQSNSVQMASSFPQMYPQQVMYPQQQQMYFPQQQQQQQMYAVQQQRPQQQQIYVQQQPKPQQQPQQQQQAIYKPDILALEADPAMPPFIESPESWFYMPELGSSTSSIGNGKRNRPTAFIPKHTSGAHVDEDPNTHQGTKGASESHGHIHFGYGNNEGPETWPQHYPQCGGKSQSPIDITVQHVEPRQMPPLIREHLWAQPDSMVVENNGHTLELDGEWHDGKWPTIRGGPLLSTYQFKQAHFHWGLHDNEGSEHTVEGSRFPMEMHQVHWNTKYPTYEEAVKHPDGLAVLAGFFEITQTNNSMIEVLLPYLRSVTGEDAKGVHMRDPTPIGILPVDLKNYVTYQGSLTTPPCSEVVTWIVPITPLTLSDKQMDRMRSIVKEGGADIHNFRDPQPLNGRKIYLNDV